MNDKQKILYDEMVAIRNKIAAVNDKQIEDWVSAWSDDLLEQQFRLDARGPISYRTFRLCWLDDLGGVV